MKLIEIARRCAELKQPKGAQDAYGMAIGQGELSPEEELEAASYILFSKGDYKIAYTSFVSLFQKGYFQAEILEILSQAFYFPNLQKLQKTYEKNCAALSAYPYLFRKDFPKFEELPIWFFPYDNNAFIPYYPDEQRFGDYVNLDDSIIDRYFFKDLSKPVLADDVYSQYQLEYLNDNVRKSEWVAKENHIYLHYTNFMTFCAYLQVLDFKKLLRDQKLVFLMEDEVSRYPIDFQKEYGIDYSTYPVKPLEVREINKLIWHTQLATHNGGDFFNEICYGHPNLIIWESVMFDEILKMIAEYRKRLRRRATGDATLRALQGLTMITDKDILVALYLYGNDKLFHPNPNERIVPALFLQPHFGHIDYQCTVRNEKRGWATLFSEQYESIRTSPIFKGFKYIKTFTPMRRPTTSVAATVRFIMQWNPKYSPEDAEKGYLPDMVNNRLLNRSYLVDPFDRLYHDSRLVRFEDGKLNPKATFTALAEFLDIPYTESMTYCSGVTGVNPESLQGNDLGFDPAAIYRTYDEFLGTPERAYLEYFMRDAYEAYGYDFQYYKGEPVDEQWVEEKVGQFTCLDTQMENGWRNLLCKNFVQLDGKSQTNREDDGDRPKITEAELEKKVQDFMDSVHEKRLTYAKYMLNGLNFINKEGQPLHPMTPLKLDPALLEQPLYR